MHVLLEKITFMNYKELSLEEGMEYLQKIWNLFLKEEDNFFAQPFSFTDERLRCYFKKTPFELTIFFHLSDIDEKYNKFKSHYENQPIPFPLPFKSTPPEKIYLYGAFNTINVVQMRSHGTLREATEPEKEEFMTLMDYRYKGVDIRDNFLNKPDKEELTRARFLLKSGKVYCFTPTNYAYSEYERG